ncbi:ferritin-like domain-containing protein [Helicobacter anatolicus]|uniref:ferritin-like domain-containing protein n=1 Tax=Helicobacter anatolicus TaxID=2905874 RepID=UPI001E4463FE|nr:ferritin-like domain-containing protein [Helicobacter anatolicus]MCE3039002.1 ferritin-like domain-containing protein [Helicobacter anatolicus]
MNFHSQLEKILFANSPQEKIQLFKDFYANFLAGKGVFEDHFSPKIMQKPSYYTFCTIVHPTRIRRPKHINSTQSLAKIIHSIAHIEYSAIDLALDASYRFINLPKEYYQDWLMVANEEIQHFLLLESVLYELGYQYGDFPVHQNLFDAQTATNHSLSHRMGLVHRALEANGLDANPFVCQKIMQSTHHAKNKFQEILDLILRDEISHVNKGDKWWKFSKTPDESFANLLLSYKNFSPLSKIINTSARLQAGYTQQELNELKEIFKH